MIAVVIIKQIAITTTSQRPHLRSKRRRRTPLHHQHILFHALQVTLPCTPKQVLLIKLLLSLSLNLLTR